LKNQVAVSFEDNHVRVVFAAQDRAETTVKRTVFLRDDEFDAFLKTNKLPNLSVVYPFRNFYSDVLSVPPAKESYLKAIIESEIRKRFPELNQFSFYYSVLADKPAEEKGLREVFFFAVDNKEINRIIERFDQYGRTVKFIYPDVLAVSHLIASQQDIIGKTILGLYASETDKVLLLIKNSQLRFIRVTPSSGKSIEETDVDNINMTELLPAVFEIESGTNRDFKRSGHQGRNIRPYGHSRRLARPSCSVCHFRRNISL
jgi:Tfp pilus assembly PilM family ATPase